MLLAELNQYLGTLEWQAVTNSGLAQRTPIRAIKVKFVP